MPECAAAVRALPASAPVWDEFTKSARADYLEWQQPVPVAGPLNRGEVVLFLRRRLPLERS
jgi:hypothetical protein